MNKDDPNEWYGTREVVLRETCCGYCMEKLHDRCVHEIGWFEKLWICGCPCNKTWKPQAVVVPKKTKEKK